MMSKRSPLFSPTRRTFLATTSLSLAGTLLRTRGVEAQPLPRSIGRAGYSAQHVLPEASPPDALRALAQRGIEAAVQAGASYADLRFGERYELNVFVWGGRATRDPSVSLNSTLTYGIRVLVDGAWAFGYGSTPDVDTIVATARNAVATARGYAPLLKRRVELAPAPVATGEWATPITEDPFSVPLADHGAVLFAYGLAASRRLQVSPRLQGFEWTKETRVFASSEGSLVTQRLHTLDSRLEVTGNFISPFTYDGIYTRYPGFAARTGGFEVVTPSAIQEDITRWTDEVDRIAALPQTTLDIGRYPVVFDGRSVGAALGTTLGRALELDRALGEEAGASGTSLIAPPLDMLGTTIASPLLSVTATRTVPAPSAVKWDDEGGEVHPYPLITGGRLVDYHTSRQHAMTLRDWYAKQGQPVRSHGSTMVPDAEAPVMIRAPHLTITPSKTPASLETLCQGITRGLLVIDMQRFRTDQSLASLFCSIQRSSHTDRIILEIVRGKSVRRLRSNALDISAKRLWKEQLVAVGDGGTVQENSFEVYKGIPWYPSLQSTATPAVLFKDVNVIAYGNI
jgi:TldD protein